MTKLCHGTKLSGANRGAPCKAKSVFEVRGKPYCVPHAAIAAKEPHRFREAIETGIRRRARHEAAARYKEAQIDAFPEDLQDTNGDVARALYAHPLAEDAKARKLI